MKMSAAEKIKKRRRREHLSQGEVGAEVGKSQVWISLLEVGRIKPKADTVRRILTAIETLSRIKKAVSEARAKAEIAAIRRVRTPDGVPPADPPPHEAAS